MEASVLTYRITSAQSYVPGGHDAVARYKVRRCRDAGCLAVVELDRSTVTRVAPGVTANVRAGTGSKTASYCTPQ